MVCPVGHRLTVSVRAFGSALVAHVAGLRFFFAGLVVCFGPMAAIRAEMPGVSVAFASIGLCHGVCAPVWNGFWAYFRASVENTMGRREKLKAASGKRLSFLKT